VTLCDTNGSSLPEQIAEAIERCRRAARDVPVGIHCHDDAACGVANSLAAVAGAPRWCRAR
jgi:2-isopropylmalate synthase